MAGYSQKSLIDKLGIKSGYTVAFLNVPYGYDKTLGKLPEYVEIHEGEGECDFIQFFVRTKKDLEVAFPLLRKHLKQDGMIWISWPKKTSTIPSEVDENDIRDIGLHYGLVDVKVCAIDNDWSGLKFVIPKHQRLS